MKHQIAKLKVSDKNKLVLNGRSEILKRWSCVCLHKYLTT